MDTKIILPGVFGVLANVYALRNDKMSQSDKITAVVGCVFLAIALFNIVRQEFFLPIAYA